MIDLMPNDLTDPFFACTMGIPIAVNSKTIPVITIQITAPTSFSIKIPLC